MIVTVGKVVGKRLTRAIVDEIRRNGFAEIAALSDLGAQRINRSAQAASNELKVRLLATPRSDEIIVSSDKRRLALIVRIEPKEDI